MKAPRRETERLILRLPEARDFDAFADFMGNGEASRYVGGPQNRAMAWRNFMAIAGSWQIHGFSMFSVERQDTGEWIGRIGPWMPEGWPGTEVGWGIVPSAQNMGFATEAATAAIDWAFDNLGWDEVIHAIAPENAPSQAVARKLGARNRGPGKLPPPLDVMAVEIWGQTRAEWRENRGNSGPGRAELGPK